MTSTCSNRQSVADHSRGGRGRAEWMDFYSLEVAPVKFTTKASKTNNTLILPESTVYAVWYILFHSAIELSVPSSPWSWAQLFILSQAHIHSQICINLQLEIVSKCTISYFLLKPFFPTKYSKKLKLNICNVPLKIVIDGENWSLNTICTVCK